MPRDIDSPRLPTPQQKVKVGLQGCGCGDQQQRHEAALVQTAGRSFHNTAGTWKTASLADCFHATVGIRDLFSSAVVVVVVATR
ncbi:unnamed protein product [Arctogadus glacialis]